MFAKLRTCVQSPVVFMLLILCLVSLSSGNCVYERSQRPIYIFGHLANRIENGRWALQQGANALEMDLDFEENGDGTPLEFKHSILCDCLCIGFLKYFHETYDNEPTMCNLLGSCSSSTSILNMLSFLSTNPNNISLVYIDSKVTSLSTDALEEGGQQVVTLLMSHLFQQGFGGRVVLSVPKLSSLAFLKSANVAINELDPKFDRSKIFFTIDEEPNRAYDVMSALVSFTSYRAFSTGKAACSLSGDIAADDLQTIIEDSRNGIFSLGPFVWTIDSRSEIDKYLSLGVQGIITNVPQRAVQVIKERDDVVLSTIHDTKELTETIGQCLQDSPISSTNKKDHLPFSAPCDSDEHCESGHCGFTSIISFLSTLEDKFCCKNGYYSYLLLSKVCTQLVLGQSCHFDNQCNEDAFCDNSFFSYWNSGVCTLKLNHHHSCHRHNQCLSQRCYETARHGDHRCCQETFLCLPWTSGNCQTGRRYCKGYLGH